MALGRHRALDCLLLLRRQGNDSLAAVELLHVDPRVVAALDCADDDAGAVGIEKRHGRGLAPAGALVRVVAHDGRAAKRRVGPPIDPRDGRRHLVHGAVQVVDARLQGHGEVGEVSLRAAEQHALGGAKPADVTQDRDQENEREQGDDCGADREPSGDVRREAHGG